MRESLRKQLCGAFVAVLLFAASGIAQEGRPSTEARPQLVLQTGYNNALGVASLTFSPDGRLLATTSLGSGTVKLWETATGRELRNIVTGAGNVSDLTPLVFFSPKSDLIATASGTFIEIWNVTTGRKVGIHVPAEVHDALVVPRVVWSANGKTLVTVTDKIIVYEVEGWRVVRSVDTRIARVDQEAVALSHDGQQVALLTTENANLQIRILNLATAQNSTRSIATEQGLRNARLSFTPEGRLQLSGISGNRVQFWDVTSGRERNLGQTSSAADVVTYAGEGRFIVLSSNEKIKIWDTASGNERVSLKLPESPLRGTAVVAISSDGTKFATGGFGISPIIWETRTGKQLLKLNGRTNLASQVNFNDDGTRLISGSRTQWDLRTGSGVRVLNDATQTRLGVLSPDSRLFAAYATSSNTVTLMEAPVGRQLHTLSTNDAGVVRSASFSSDGSRLLTIHRPPAGSSLRIWDVKSGRELQQFAVGDSLFEAKLSPTSRYVGALENVQDKDSFTLWDARTGKLLRIDQTEQTVTSFAFSRDDETLALSQIDRRTRMTMGIVLWDLANAREVLRLPTSHVNVSMVFSRDKKLLAVGSSDETIAIWDLESTRLVRTLTGHTAPINSIDFSPDNKLLASASDDGSTFLWDTSTGEHLLTLISLDDGDEWMVVTPQGIFDGTPQGWNQILWRYDEDTFNVAPIEWFFNEFYYPGLLAEVFAGKRPRVAEDVSKKDRRQPVVELSAAGESSPTTNRRVKVKIGVTDAPPDKENPRGTGAYDLRLFRNGSLVKVWHGDVLKGQSTVTLEEEIAVTAGPNRLTAYAFNRDNVKSKDAQLSIVGAESLRRAGTAYILAVGLNEYQNAQYNLKYAVADAEAFSAELRRKLGDLSRFESVEIVSLLNQNATKSNIIAALKRLGREAESHGPSASPAFDRLKRAAPEDAVIIYFAGHGTAKDQHFYLIPHDLGYTGEREQLDDEGLQSILSHSISDVELAQTVENLNAGHLLLFIDACNSGQALEAEEKRRGPMNSKGLAQLAYEKGMYILTAAQSYQAALEAAQLGHGLLTYALVEEGLKRELADTEPRDGVLKAREWLDFATERVPEMQLSKMKESRGIGLAFAEGEEDILDPEKRSVQRPRVFYRRELEANALVISGSDAALAQSAAAAAPQPTSAGRFSRWIDLQAANIGVRYRFIENSAGITVANQLQHYSNFRGRFKFDAAGNYSINAGVFTGNTFNAGFNDTGLGTGDAVTNLYLKQLYFSAKPIRGLEVQYGGLYFNRGESTEITSYDNDGYLMGQRIVVQRPKTFFFDEISVTYAFLGDLLKPNINRRWHGLGKSNYHQFLISKKMVDRAVLSADYTFESGRDTFRQAIRVNTPELKVIDLFRLELYERASVNPKAGLAASIEKALLNKRLSLAGGYAQIDRQYGGLNGDRFMIGKRFHFTGSYKLTEEFTITTFYTRAFANDFPVPNRTRFEVLFNYNLLKTLQKAKIF